MNDVVEAFYREYWEKGALLRADWLGTRAAKCPLDLWVYQEIIFRTRPDLIVETGTWAGGSALFLATICDILGTGRILTIDIEGELDEGSREVVGGPGRPEHPRITYLTGSSISPEITAEVRGRIGDQDRVMAILDSDHSKEHVLAELRTYGPLVSEGCYLIAEDTSVGRVVPEFAEAGAKEAVDEFLKEEPSFAVDRSCEKFLMTFHPGGYLRRGS